MTPRCSQGFHRRGRIGSLCPGGVAQMKPEEERCRNSPAVPDCPALAYNAFNHGIQNKKGKKNQANNQTKKPLSKQHCVFHVVLEMHRGIMLCVFKMKSLLPSCFTFKLNTSMFILTPVFSKVPAAEHNLFPGCKPNSFHKSQRREGCEDGKEE